MVNWNNWLLIGSAGFFIIFVLIASESDPSFDLIPVHPRIVDRPDMERVELSYTNNSKHFLCMSYGNWPNSDGWLDSASGSFALVVRGRKHPIEDHNFGYCIGGDKCGVRVSPGSSIQGFLPYGQFRLPEELRYEQKRLEYSIVAYVCDVIPKPLLDSSTNSHSGRNGVSLR